MILRQVQWILLTTILYSIIIVKSQNDRSYDTNDWIPITPTPNANVDASKVAAGRVLNLDAPAQKFFPEENYNYLKGKPQAQQFLRENPQNPRHKYKNTDGYVFQVPPKAQPVRLATYEQPPPIAQGEFKDNILTRQQAPAVDASSIYDQYHLPFNSSFYQSLNPGSINRELQNSFENQNLLPEPAPSASIKDEKQDVQLLYVPLENLKHNQQAPQNVFHQFSAPSQKQQIFAQNNQHLIDDIEHDLIQQTVQAHRLQQQIHLGRGISDQPTTTTSTTTTPKPTKRKPHQPPLAVYLENNHGSDIDDVLNALKDAKSIAVQDAVLPNSPKVFIGPSTINLPSTYTRFPLPYINKIEGNRIERKVENLPFFVAPLSYKTPSGYSKIPLPSPHVGSVVVSNKEDSHKRSAPKPVPTYPNQIKEYETVKPSYSVPSGTPNPQVFDPSQLTYYSSTPLLNRNNEAQRSNYLQFGVNDVSQYSVSSKPTEQLQQPLSVNNIPSNNQHQTSNTPVSSFKNPVQSVSYNQASIANTSPQTATQQIVPDRNNNPYSSPVRNANEQNKYTFNQDQNINSYRTPIPVSNRETISSYQIPVSNPTGVTQYNEQINENKEAFTVPQPINKEEQNSYHTPSRGPQRNRHPSTPEGLSNTVTPSISTTSHHDKPPSYVSSQYGEAHEISITPKTTTTTTTTKPAEDPYRYSFDGGPKKQNPLELTINQYELHQINSELVPETTEKETKDPYDFSSPFRYEYRPKDFDYSSKFAVEKSKMKGKYDYSSVFDIDVDKPKFDYSSEFDRYTSTPASILRDTYEDIPTTPRVSAKSRRRGKPTRQPARTTTTEHTPGRESYTVLEEFSVKPANTPQTTEALKELTFEEKYKIPTPPDIPAILYRGRTTSPKYEEVKVEPVTIQYDNIKTVIEDVPSKTNVKQNTPAYTRGGSENIPTQNFDKQIVQSNFGRQEEVTHPPTYVQSPLTEVSYSPDYNENSDIKPLVQNRGQKQQDQSYSFEKRPPNLPDYTSNLQDHSVRTPLLPNPSTEDYSNPNIESIPQQPLTTTTTTTTTTSTERPVTTHATRGRGRQRGGSRFSSASATTVASVPRRTVNRRRPVHTTRTTTTTTESPSSQYSSNEDYPKVTRQRFRTRGRPSQTVATERISSTENEVRSYREPTSETPVEIQTDPTNPQSYMKFEHTVEDQKVIIQQEEVPVTDYPQYYSPQLPVTVTDSPRLVLQYDNTASTENPIMDIQITHPAPKIKKQPAIRTNDDGQVHLRAGGHLHNNRNNYNEDSPRQTTRVRGRGRSRPRVATTTTEKPAIKSTGRPVIRIAPKRTTTVGTTTTTTPKPEYKSAAEEEFFGFIRQPNFNQVYNIPVPAATEQPLHVYQNNPNQPADTDVRVGTYQVFGGQNSNPNIRAQSYQIPQDPQPVDDVRVSFNGAASDPTTVRFVGEIRPKYRPTTQSYEESVAVTDSTEPPRAETDTPRPRVRGRVRTSLKKSSTRPSENEVSTQQATRRSNVIRSRGRGAAHYRPPENLRSKEDKDAEVEGGNYPPQFFQNRQAVVTTAAPTFQISIDPAGEDEYGDQLPNPSLYQPKTLPRPDEWTEVTETTANDEEFAPANEIEDDIHIRGETVSPDEIKTTTQAKETSTKATTADDGQTPDQPVALPVTSSDELTTQSSDEAYKEDTKAMEELFEEVNKTEKPRKAKGRRRGVWKLIRQRPVDTYEVAESQNYYSVVNAYKDIAKVKDKLKYDKGSEETKLGQHELYNNYNPVLEQNSETYDYESQKLPSTEKVEHKTNKYYEVHDLNAETEKSVLEALTTVQPEVSENGTETNTQPGTTTVKDSSLFDTIYEMFGISKSEDVDESTTTTTSTAEPETVPPTTTTASPTFPEEITELTTTEGALESTSSGSTGTTEEQESTSPKTQLTRTFDVEPWQMKAVRTSTSTEVSHETEICYKGRCVRSNDRKGL